MSCCSDREVNGPPLMAFKLSTTATVANAQQALKKSKKILDLPFSIGLITHTKTNQIKIVFIKAQITHKILDS